MFCSKPLPEKYVNFFNSDAGQLNTGTIFEKGGLCL